MKLGRAALVVLGCAKNQVEAETISSRLAQMGWQLTSDFSAASVVVVHSCAFLEAARREARRSLTAIRRCAPRAFLVLTGCYAQYLNGKRPSNVDALLGTGDLQRLPELLVSRKTQFDSLSGRCFSPGGFHDASLSRPLRRDQLSAYLRISEGCSRRCSFCVIPQLRGNLQSRQSRDILQEARGLVRRGVKELVLISQDTTAYGADLGAGSDFISLLRKILAVRGLRWMRVMYAHPCGVNEKFIRLLAEDERLCRYLDMPLQHISDRILRSMRRDMGEKQTMTLLERLRARVPGLSLRTSFITGYPGETEADFKRLLAVVEAEFFEHVGVFLYSQEKRTASSRLAGSVPHTRAEERRERLIAAQSRVVTRRNASRIGKTLDVLCEREPNGCWIGRGRHQAPEVDGIIRLDSAPLQAGIYRTRVTGVAGVDLAGELIDGDCGSCSADKFVKCGCSRQSSSVAEVLR